MKAGGIRAFSRKYRNLLLFSSLHAVILLILTFWWMQLHWQFGDELFVARINQIAKYLVLRKENPAIDSLKSDLVLINCSFDKMLVPFSDDFGDGTKVVTDRLMLTQFFRRINEGPIKPKLVLVDIFFDYASEYDSLLFSELQKIPNAVFSTYREKTNELSRPVPGLNYALAQYESTGMFLKYSLLSPDYKYVPAALYEITTGDTIRKKMGAIRSSRGWWMNTFTVDIAVRQAQIGDGSGMVLWNLGDALRNIPETDFQNSIANKIVVVGDYYERDIHETLLGDQPGPLIIVNAYLALILGVPLIGFDDILYLFVLYFITTVYILRLKAVSERAINRNIQKWWLSRFLIKYFSYLFIFSCFTVVLYVLTLKHFQLVLFAFYFNLFEFLVSKYRDSKATKDLKPSDTSVVT